jgi:hypothetical protein
MAQRCSQAAAPRWGEDAFHVRRLIRLIRRHQPRTEILLRADSLYCAPQFLALCDRLGLRQIFGLSRNSRLAESVLLLETSTAAPCSREPGQKPRQFRKFSYTVRS